MSNLRSIVHNKCKNEDIKKYFTNLQRIHLAVLSLIIFFQLFIN